MIITLRAGRRPALPPFDTKEKAIYSRQIERFLVPLLLFTLLSTGCNNSNGSDTGRPSNPGPESPPRLRLIPLTLSAQAAPDGIAAADFTGDGGADLVVSDVESADLILFEQTSSGIFGRGRIVGSSGAGPVSLATGTFNPDAIPDLISANLRSSNFSLLLSTAPGSFGPGDAPGFSPPTTGCSRFSTGPPLSVISADFNSDSKIEKVIASNSESITIFTSNGDGTFAPAEGLGPMVLTPSAPTSAPDGTLTYSGFGSQLFGDGRIKRVEVCLTVRSTGDDTYDVAVSSDGGTTFSSTLRATPQSTIRTPESEILDFSTAALWTPDKISNANLRVRLTPLRKGTMDTVTVEELFFRTHLLGSPAAATAANFNKKVDGATDLAVTDVSGAFTTLLQDESGAFPPNNNGNGHYALNPDGGGIPRAIAAGEYTGDGAIDLVVAHSGGKFLQLFLNNGLGRFSAGPLIETGLAPSALIAADFDGDGRMDIASANFGDDAVSIHFGSQDAKNPFPAFVTGKSGDGPIAMAGGDFNGDGRLDLAVTNRLSASVTVLLNLPP